MNQILNRRKLLPEKDLKILPQFNSIKTLSKLGMGVENDTSDYIDIMDGPFKSPYSGLLTSVCKHMVLKYS